MITDVKISNDGLIQNSMEKGHPHSRIITIRSLNENKIITSFHIHLPGISSNHNNKQKEGEEGEDKKEEEEDEDKKEEDQVLSEPYDFMEYHNGYLYVKYEEHAALKVYDCRDSRKEAKLLNPFEVPDAYLFLKRCNRLLYYKHPQIDQIENYNINNIENNLGIYGVLDLVSGENIELEQAINNANHRESVMCVTQNQSKIIYYSKFKNKQRQNKREGIIQINSLENGQLFGFIKCTQKMMENQIPLNHRWCLAPQTNKQRENIFINKNPLRHITSIYFNEYQNEIYTGNRNGDILVWA